MEFPYQKVLIVGCGGVPYKLFTTRGAAYAWLDGFDAKRQGNGPYIKTPRDGERKHDAF